LQKLRIFPKWALWQVPEPLNNKWFHFIMTVIKYVKQNKYSTIWTESEFLVP
jgi:hypothetical protein